MLQRGALQHPYPDALLSGVCLKWQPRGGGGSLPAAVPPVPVWHPATQMFQQVGRKGHGSIHREIFLRFTVVKWLKLLSSCRWVWVPWGCLAVNHGVRAMQAALMWSVLGVWSNTWGMDRTAGLLPSDAPFGMSPMGRNATCACGLLPLPVLAAPCLLLCYSKHQPEPLQSAS